jgi:hypothetical protein
MESGADTTKKMVAIAPDDTRAAVQISSKRVREAKARMLSAIESGKEQVDQFVEETKRRTASGQMAAVDPLVEMEKIGKPSALRAPTPPPLPRR